jgi:predicted DNA binding CopG/RHH family protein
MNVDYSNNELEILKSIEQGEWSSVAHVSEEKRRYQGYAEAALRKDRRINIRITERDLKEIQRRAVKEGIPYQTLVSSLIHKYTTDRLIDVGALEPLLKQKGK